MNLAIPERSALLAMFLTAVLVFMGVKIYRLWHDGPWELPQQPAVSSPAVISAPEVPATQPRAVAPDPSVRAPALAEGSYSGFRPVDTVAGATGSPAGLHFIISKNLFDPERGATQTKEAEANSRAMQRLKSLVLLGTAIIGESRYAIIQESGAQAAGRPSQGQSNQTMRFKTGDIFEGFKLSQIQDKNVVFTNGGARVELALDYFRKIEPSAPIVASAPRPQPGAPVKTGAAPTPVAPRVVPQLPRRDRLPAPPTS